MFPGPDPRNSIQKLLQQAAQARALGAAVPSPVEKQPPQSNPTANVGQDFRTKRIQFNPDPPNPLAAPGVKQQYWNDATELAERSIMGSQQTSHPGLSKLLYKGIDPVGYDLGPKLNESLGSMLGEHPETPRTRIDAWRMYLGLPQEHNTFAISPYRPSKETNPNATYYKLNNFWQAVAQDPMSMPAAPGSLWDIPAKTPSVWSADQALQRIAHEASYQHPIDWPKMVMGRYKLSRGQDERGPYYSYYDKWDLGENPIEGDKGRFGKPFEIYDRLYYDPVKRTIDWPK